MSNKNQSYTIGTQRGLGQVILHHFPVIAYAALIYYISSLPGINPPSIGISWEDKIYHFGEYALFSFFTFIALRYYRADWIKRNIYIFAALIACLFALTDELHQFYVPGRESTLSDLISDCCGAVTTQLLIWTILRLKKPKRD